MKRLVSVLLTVILIVSMTGTASAVLKYGSEDEDVVKLQQRLIELGYLDGEAKGVFDEITEEALIAFQEANGLEATGTASIDDILLLFSDDAVAASGTDVDSDASEQGKEASEESEYLFTLPIGYGYVVGEDLSAGEYLVIANENNGSISLSAEDYYGTSYFFCDEGVTGIFTLTDGMLIDAEHSSFDFYSFPGFSYDDSEAIALPIGNHYVVGEDIPAGTYSGYAEGNNYGVRVCVMDSSCQDMEEFLPYSDGDVIGKITFEEGQVLYIQTGTLHLTPYTGLSGVN